LDTPQPKTPIYHFTHYTNLTAILQTGGLSCETGLAEGAYANVGNRQIKDRRKLREVPIPPFGVVADYVPFYFAPRSPMLFAIHKANVPGCTYGQDEVIYIVAHAEDIGNELPCCFTDRNAVLASAEFYNDLNMLHENLDWPLLKNNYWANTPDDLERKERRMAEFLVHRNVPWLLVRGIGVYDEKHLGYVKRILSSHGSDLPKVKVLSPWYF
jgi:hypothetical protein